MCEFVRVSLIAMTQCGKPATPRKNVASCLPPSSLPASLHPEDVIPSSRQSRQMVIGSDLMAKYFSHSESGRGRASPLSDEIIGVSLSGLGQMLSGADLDGKQ